LLETVADLTPFLAFVGVAFTAGLSWTTSLATQVLATSV
jgi:hypothetical protein